MTNLLDLPLDQFRGYLAEGNYPQARRDELMRAYRAKNSLAGYLDRYGEDAYKGRLGLLDDGNMKVSSYLPVAVPKGMSIWDGLKSGRFQTRFKDYASDALGGVLNALNNPRDSYQGTLPQADYDSAAMGTGGLAMGGGGVVAAPAGSLRSFAGRTANTADLDALKVAQELSARKRDPEDIFRQTGWFKGKDGQWRFEIDDSQAEFIGNSQTTGLLGDVMRHDALYAAYPDLKNTPVSTDVQRLQSGSYQPEQTKYPDGRPRYTPLNEEILAFGPTKPAILNTLLHEAGGHALQRREGFAPGSSRGVATDQLLLERNTFLKNLSDKMDARQAELGLSGYRPATNDPELKRLREQYDANVDRALDEDAIYERYYTEAGEVEARNIQLRQDMTPAERRALSPMATEDVPRSEQRLSGDGQSGLLAEALSKDSIAEMRRLRRIERFGYDPEEQPAPASGGFDAYLSTVNPSGKRIQSENRPNLRMGDMYGMLPKSAQKVSSVDDVDIMRDGDDFYAVAYNPDVGEIDVVGYAQRGEGETDLMVVQEMQGKGVGGELQYQYRSANPTAPTGGLTEAGEGLLRNTYSRLRDDGTVNANASKSTGLLAAGLPEPRNAGEAMAQRILEMRAAGKAGDVTDEMMAQADPQYMYNNTPLDMSEAARMARAEGAGFDVDLPLYHGTDKDFQKFNPRAFGLKDPGWYGRGVYSDTDTEVAGGYANYDELDIGQNIMPIFARGRYMDWPDANQPFSNRESSIEGTNEISSLGYDGVRISNDRDFYGDNPDLQTEQVTFNPANIRSRFARFDPEFSHLSNLSAANASAPVGLLAAQPSTEDELRQYLMQRGLLQ